MSTIRSLPSLVRAQFQKAQESGDLTFYATRVAILHCAGFAFQLRFSPALAQKPKANRDPNKKPIDPFENPSKALFVADVGAEHYAVLNKFPVIPDHFILATRGFKQQTDFLEEGDLGAAWECLRAYRENGEELFGFFNSGQHSGASQPHRHIQFLPVESMRSGMNGGAEWSVLADKLVMMKLRPMGVLPFEYFSSALPADPSPGELHKIYKGLYEEALECVKRYAPDHVLETTQEEETAISYNLGLTDHVMVLCPRLSEGSQIKGLNDESIGPVALNGTLLAGTLLVKSDREWDALENDDTKLTGILEAIGVALYRNGFEERL